MTPAHPDMFAMPDPESLIQLPWQPEVGWLAGDLWMDGKEVGAARAWCSSARSQDAAADGWRMKTGVECEYFLLPARREGDGRRRAIPRKSPATTSRR